MMKKFVYALAVTGLMISLAPAFATMAQKPETSQQPSSSIVHNLPKNATEVAPDVLYLGQHKDNNGKLLDGYAIIDRRSANAKPGNSAKPGGSSTCYAFLASGAKWKTVEPYRFDANNADGLATTTIQLLLANDLNKWESAAGVQIFGSQEPGPINAASIGNSANSVNEVVFGNITSSGVIAVTYAWGIFGGNPAGRVLSEWDMVINDVGFDWSADATGVTGKMDFENITTHETGHAAGLGHPSDSCADETMYRYADFGETKKRDLNPGDTTGVRSLYR